MQLLTTNGMNSVKPVLPEDNLYNPHLVLSIFSHIEINYHD